MAKAKKMPVQKIFKLKPFKVKRNSVKMPKLPRIKAKKIKI